MGEAQIKKCREKLEAYAKRMEGITKHALVMEEQIKLIESDITTLKVRVSRGTISKNNILEDLQKVIDSLAVER